MPSDARFPYLGAAADINDKLQAGGWFGHDDEPSDFARCLPVLLMAMEWQSNVHYICNSLPYHVEHLDLLDFRNTMGNLGFTNEAHHGVLHELDTRLFPCLFVPDDPQQYPSAVVILPTDDVEPDEMAVFDGIKNEMALLSAAEPVSGTAYFFKKITTDHDQDDSLTSTFPKFTSILLRFRHLFTQMAVASIAINMLALAGPIFIMLTYDRVIGPNSIETLKPLILGVSLAIIIELWLRILRTHASAWFGSRLDHIVSVGIFERLLFLPAIFTERAAVASQVARIKGFEAVRDFFTGPLFIVFLELPFVVITLITIGLIAGPVVWVPICMLVFYALLIGVTFPYLRHSVKETARNSSARQEFIIENYAKMHALRHSSFFERWLQRFRELSGHASYTHFRSRFFISIIETISYSVSIFSGVVVIMFSIGRIWENQMTAGALVATMILSWRVLSPLQTMCAALIHLEQVFSSIVQVNRLMEIKPERDPRIVPHALRHLDGHIEFFHVGLRYSKDVDPVFANLSFNLEPGEMMAITGVNGAGKTTVLKLLNGLYHPQIGHISIDGMDIRQMDPIELRQHIAYLSQEPDFFYGTIAENLRLIAPLATEEELIGALKQADIWHELEELGHGIHTKLTEGYLTRLSSSFLYRLNLARIYVSDSRILLLDELPDSVLSSDSGKAYLEFLEKQCTQRSILLITRDPKYFKMADKLLLLAPGETPRVGDYETLKPLLDPTGKAA